MKYKFYIEKDSPLKVELRNDEPTIDLYINGECVGYFDDDGLNLLPDCNIPEDLKDERGRLKIRKGVE